MSSTPFFLIFLPYLFFFSSWFFCFSSSAGFDLTPISFDEGYSPLFGDFNLVRSPDGNSVRLLLDVYSGSGFISSNMYAHGFFSAKIKLPSDNTAGVVVAFYASNGDVFEKAHDELDIEFLGNVRGKPWRFQTNLYGNGSTSRGREERYRLWFDPSKEFHRYSILWTTKNIIFYVDEVPIREVIRSDEMGGDYPTKPMSLYATIWDASSWATGGGKIKVNYDYAPFTAEFRELVLDGCPMDPIQEYPDFTICNDKDAWLDTRIYSFLSPKRRAAMYKFRQHYMYYSSCYDVWRYPVRLPGCVIDPIEKERFNESGRLKFERSHKKQARAAKARRERKSRSDT
ncbi:hypothetical protein GQ457_15G008100 [Hibiscus cannabinus]